MCEPANRSVVWRSCQWVPYHTARHGQGSLFSGSVIIRSAYEESHEHDLLCHLRPSWSVRKLSDFVLKQLMSELTRHFSVIGLLFAFNVIGTKGPPCLLLVSYPLPLWGSCSKIIYCSVLAFFGATHSIPSCLHESLGARRFPLLVRCVRGSDMHCTYCVFVHHGRILVFGHVPEAGPSPRHSNSADS